MICSFTETMQISFISRLAAQADERTGCLQDVKSQRSFGIHCCTFNLTDEPLDEPPQLLEQEARAAGLSKHAFVTLQHGGMLQTANGTDLNQPLTMV